MPGEDGRTASTFLPCFTADFPIDLGHFMSRSWGQHWMVSADLLVESSFAMHCAFRCQTYFIVVYSYTLVYFKLLLKSRWYHGIHQWTLLLHQSTTILSSQMLQITLIRLFIFRGFTATPKNSDLLLFPSPIHIVHAARHFRLQFGARMIIYGTRILAIEAGCFIMKSRCPALELG